MDDFVFVAKGAPSASPAATGSADEATAAAAASATTPVNALPVGVDAAAIAAVSMRGDDSASGGGASDAQSATTLYASLTANGSATRNWTLPLQCESVAICVLASARQLAEYQKDHLCFPWRSNEMRGIAIRFILPRHVFYHASTNHLLTDLPNGFLNRPALLTKSNQSHIGCCHVWRRHCH